MKPSLTNVQAHLAGCPGLGPYAAPVTLWVYERRCTAACGAWQRAWDRQTDEHLRRAAVARGCNAGPNIMRPLTGAERGATVSADNVRDAQGGAR